MPFNLLLIPLIGGYFFVCRWNRTRFYALRADSQRILIYAASAGVVFMLAATLICAFLHANGIGSSIDARWHKYIPIEDSGRAAMAFAMAVTLWKPLNWLWKRDREVERVVQDRQDPLEVMLRHSLGNAKLLAFSMKNHKIYVGRVSTNINPAFPIEHIEIVPFSSGYRDPVTKKVTFVNAYAPVIEQIATSVETAELEKVKRRYPHFSKRTVEAIAKRRVANYEGQSRFVVVIPRAEIQSVNYFDPEIYEKHFAAFNTAEQGDLLDGIPPLA